MEKNIHILLIDGASKLYRTIPKNNYALAKKEFVGGSHMENLAIYITSDEEIEVGDWVITTNNDLLLKIENDSECCDYHNHQYASKVILTTDPKLIADGIQEIDSEFLENFIKCPDYSIAKVTKHSNRTNPYEIDLIMTMPVYSNPGVNNQIFIKDIEKEK